MEAWRKKRRWKKSLRQFKVQQMRTGHRETLECFKASTNHSGVAFLLFLRAFGTPAQASLLPIFASVAWKLNPPLSRSRCCMQPQKVTWWLFGLKRAACVPSKTLQVRLDGIVGV